MKINERWTALDVVKTLGFFGPGFGHIFLWYWGINLAPESGAFLYRLDQYQRLGFIYWPFVMFLIISAGSGMYFYLRNRNNLLRIFKRSLIFITLGILLGLSTDPFIIFWNIFIFYSISFILFSIIWKYFNLIGIIAITIGGYILTPVFRLFFTHIENTSYIANAIVGDFHGITSTFPLMPWISFIGVGFILGYLYDLHREYMRKKENIILSISVFIALTSALILPPLDWTNVFGQTARLAMAYPIFFCSLFIGVIILADKWFRDRELGKYNPLRTIGESIMPVYIISLLVMLGITNFVIDNAIISGNTKSLYEFIRLTFIAFAVAYITSIIFIKKINRKTAR
jgi:hypothetical protein